MIALTATRLFTPLQQIDKPLLLIEEGAIVGLSTTGELQAPAGARLTDLGDAVLAPAFVDIHIHGGAGHDVMTPDSAGLAAMERMLAKHGVSSYFPTTVTAPLDKTLPALEHLADTIEARQKQSPDELRARPLGIHLEGPFISHVRRGVHPPENLLPPTVETFERFWQAARGQIRMMTIAPELPGAREVIAEAARRGVCVSVGHSDADLETTRAAVAAGARHATHTFNAMRPLGHRDPGIIGEVLTDARLSADIIADGIHVAPEVVQLFLNQKGTEKTVLITDATAATGMPDGRYRLGDFEVEVSNGMCTANGSLAGSVLTMDRAIRNVMQFGHWTLQQAVRAATWNPAQVAALADQGNLKEGARADLVVLSPEGEVRNTIIHGAGV